MLAEQGRISVLMESTITLISEQEVLLDYQEQELLLVNSAVIICAGGELPTAFINKIGIQVATKYGTA